MFRLLRFVLWAVAGVVLVLLVAVAAGIWANHRAAQAARALCEAIRPGSPERSAVELGRSKAGRHVQAANEHRFFFQGWVFNGTVCTVRVDAGAVVGTAVSQVQD